MRILILFGLIAMFASAGFADTAFKCGDARLISAPHNIYVELQGHRISLAEQDDGSWAGSEGDTIYTYYTGTEDESRLQISKENPDTGATTVVSDHICE